MKSIASLLPFICLLLFAVASTTAFPLMDSDGKVLRNGDAAFLSPIGGGGIFSAAIRHNNSDACSLAVITSSKTNVRVSMSRLTLDLHPLTTEGPLNVRFTYVPPNICTSSGSWTVVRSPTLGDSVMQSGPLDSGSTIVSGEFYFKAVDFAKLHYKLVFCSPRIDRCENIGVRTDSSGLHRLVVTTGEPLVFKFDTYNPSRNFNSGLSKVV